MAEADVSPVFEMRLDNPWIGRRDLDRPIPFRLGDPALQDHEIIDELGEVRDTRAAVQGAR